MKYSFVIPCYNSENTISIVVNEIAETMNKENITSFDYEIVLINDYSKDNTGKIIKQLAQTHNNITAIQFSKNFGQDSACLAGYAQTSGQYIITLDDDGQTPACEVMTLINKLEEGYDVVFGKYPQKHHSKFRNWGSRVNDFMACKLINKPKDL
ncbi:MAG: glycosyltransferase [Erysipelotrichaceae bacterium]|nr:glycosyltransferase [Erysipelotrichaceae bacterium]